MPAEPTYQYALLLGISFFLHLLVVPDYLIYIGPAASIAPNAPFPYQRIDGTLYYKDVVHSNFSQRGTFTCDSAASCLSAICTNGTQPTNYVNNICLHPVLDWQRFNADRCGGSSGELESSTGSSVIHSYTWIFAICMVLVVLEFLALLCWGVIYRTPYANQFSTLVFTPSQLSRYVAIVSWVMHAVTLVTSLLLLAAAPTSTLVLVIMVIVVRLIGIGLVTTAVVLDLQQQQKVLVGLRPDQLGSDLFTYSPTSDGTNDTGDQ